MKMEGNRIQHFNKTNILIHKVQQNLTESNQDPFQGPLETLKSDFKKKTCSLSFGLIADRLPIRKEIGSYTRSFNPFRLTLLKSKSNNSLQDSER